MEARAETPLPPRLLLYDGVCGLCAKGVQFFVRHDREGVLRYAPLQGETAARLRQIHPEIPVGIDSLILVEEGRVYLRSRAVFRTLAHLPAPWRWFSWLAVFPTFLADPPYNLMAATRYRIWGRHDTCRIPTPDEAARFLD
jgi:predicted DCC family thiol-disulfide oxidoreductase YuxK